MTDYGRPLSFGVSLDPSAGAWAQTRRLARRAEDSGLDHLAVQDHPYQPGHLDAWTLITHLSAATDRISFLTGVADLQLRPPVMLAKAAASLSVLTGGRIQLGVGGGGIPDAIASMGGPARRGQDMVAFTEESLGLLRTALAGDVVRLHSPYHSVDGYRAGPVPPKPVELWLGAQKPRMLAVTGRLADGWIAPLNIYVPPQEVPSRQRIIDGAAADAGRDPSTLRRVYNVIGVIGEHGDGPGLVGDARRWVDTLTEWAVDLGFDTFVFWPATDPERQLARFAGEVVPAVRERVDAIRSGR
ncbi:LLM class flavin-dependent oxidoreductase [Streptomyces sp. PSKA30]|uniref:LLM class flavin-dependent oxidoreductase n=1 Tax=Streptomyces sp. PSKA30 TaxID=2874597 RepID=UPI001CD0DB1F|nr:LLM class flavin-dependent oxidoreductase [Streptomyces sp. PSKA30]MBZ9644622.1 LLM class flavin-dependent oxidoreductase [Streptomyces sp. PSKA30]